MRLLKNMRLIHDRHVRLLTGNEQGVEDYNIIVKSIMQPIT